MGRLQPLAKPNPGLGDYGRSVGSRLRLANLCMGLFRERSGAPLLLSTISLIIYAGRASGGLGGYISYVLNRQDGIVILPLLRRSNLGNTEFRIDTNQTYSARLNSFIGDNNDA